MYSKAKGRFFNFIRLKIVELNNIIIFVYVNGDAFAV